MTGVLGAYLYRVPLEADAGAVTGTVAFNGTGTLALASTRVATGTTAFTGTGTLGLTSTTVRTGSTGFTGTGTLGLTGTVIPSSSILFNGEGHLNANAVRVAQGAVSMSGTGTVMFAATVVRKATLAYQGSGFLDLVATEPSDMYTPGPCDDWDPIWGTCLINLPTEAHAFTGSALTAASEILWQLTAQRFGLCRVALRPCRASCVSESDRGAGWWEFGSYPYPTWIAGAWFNLGCAGCTSGCSCTVLQETLLPGPIAAMVEVKVDGTVLDPAAYEVHDYRKLVRIDGGSWPLCNNFTLPTTETGTWSVTADYGEPVPVTGRIAAGELACEIARSLAGLDCDLPSGVQQITRQGVSMTFNEYTDVLDNGLVGLPHSDRFIKLYNPKKLMARSAVFDLDSSSRSHRVVGL